MKFPEKCPYCGKDNAPHIVSTAPFKRVNDAYGYGAELHECVHCHQPIFLFKKSYWHKTIYAGTEIVQYLPVMTNVEYPERVKQLSPDAYECFSQAMQAKAMGLNTLAGAGLRIALEQLVWDYLIKKQKLSKTSLFNLRLEEKIMKMQSSEYAKVCSDLVRIYGNREIHVGAIQKISFEEAYTAYRGLCDVIESELLVLNASSRINT